MRMHIALLFVPVVFVAANALAEDHQRHNHEDRFPESARGTPLTEPGNDAFAAIQEAVDKLMADPNTDWSRVNLEALRQHLVDMNNFTLHVRVVSQKPIRRGVEFSVIPTTPDAAGSLDRLFAAHPAILRKESGWEMNVKKIKGVYNARVTSRNPGDAEKIRGLGYIGIIALGKHHQLHHWQMATGVNPHEHRR
jgi:hypothetical protein